MILVHPEKASGDMYDTLFGISMEVKPEQSQNALSSISVTLSGISIEVKSVQSLNALSPIDLTIYVSPSYVIVLGILISPA